MYAAAAPWHSPSAAHVAQLAVESTQGALPDDGTTTNDGMAAGGLKTGGLKTGGLKTGGLKTGGLKIGVATLATGVVTRFMLGMQQRATVYTVFQHSVPPVVLPVVQHDVQVYVWSKQAGSLAQLAAG